MRMAHIPKITLPLLAHHPVAITGEFVSWEMWSEGRSLCAIELTFRNYGLEGHSLCIEVLPCAQCVLFIRGL